MDDIKRLILRKLTHSNVWGGKHLPLDIVINGLPSHQRNTSRGKREVRHALLELVNEGWVILLVKRTGKGADTHISLNQRNVAKIMQFLGHDPI